MLKENVDINKSLFASIIKNMHFNSHGVFLGDHDIFSDHSNHCKHPAHSCVMGCKERGGALPTVTALTAQGITIMHLPVVQLTVSTTHGDTQYSVNKQTN